MAHATAISPSVSYGGNSSLAASSRQQRSQRLSHFGHPAVFLSFSQINVREKRFQHVKPLAGLPLLSLAAETEQYEFINKFNDWTLDAQTLKNIYLAFSLFFCWGCCVFASMKDPFYDSDTYRGAGGDGTGNWIYNLEEDEGVDAREELWREELAREIEERVGEMKEIEEAKKEKELV